MYAYLSMLEHWLALPTGSKEEIEYRGKLAKVRDRLPDRSDCPIQGDPGFIGPTLPDRD